jgi:hypothetical protein
MVKSRDMLQTCQSHRSHTAIVSAAQVQMERVSAPIEAPALIPAPELCVDRNSGTALRPKSGPWERCAHRMGPCQMESPASQDILLVQRDLALHNGAKASIFSLIHLPKWRNW